MPLYFILEIFSFIVPFIFSFEKKLQFYKNLSSIIISISINAFLFIVWDFFFIQYNVWWFNKDYLIGIYVFGIPIEEILFFFLIPYSSIFIHYTIQYYLHNIHLKRFYVLIFLSFNLIISTFIIYNNYEKIYTNLVLFATTIANFIYYRFNKQLLSSYLISFIVIIIPFTIVNGILTGGFTSQPIVYYNSLHILNFRIFTIPIEDFVYCYILILNPLFIYEKFFKK